MVRTDGRDELLERLRRGLRLEERDGLRVTVLAGPAGIGKTHLVDALVAGAATSSAVVATARCVPDGGATPLAPIREVLAGLGVARPWAEHDGHEARALAAESALREASSATRAVLLVLEDLHWADASTLELLRVLVHRCQDVPVAMVLTHRPVDHTQRWLRGLLAALDRSPGTLRVDVPPLPPHDATRMAVAAAGGRLDTATLAALVERAEGVPLFLRELVTTARRDDGVALPVRVQEIFDPLLERMDRSGERALAAAAVCGLEVPHALLVALLAAAGDDPTSVAAERALDALLDADVLVVAPDGDGYRFRHALLREAALTRVRPVERRRLHERLADVITARPDLLPPEVRAARLAHHRAGAGEPGPALAATVAAARNAAAAQAHAEALLLYRRALRWLPAVPHDATERPSELALLSEAARSADRAGAHDVATALLEAALSQPLDPAVRRALRAELAVARYLDGDIVGAGHEATEALAAAAVDRPEPAVALLRSLTAFVAEPDVAPVVRSAEAVQEGRACGEPAVVGTLLAAHGLALAVAGDAAAAAQALDEADRLEPASADPRDVLRPAVYRMLAAAALGRDLETVLLGRRAATRADELGVSKGVGRQIRSVLVDALLALGRDEEATGELDAALAWGDGGLTGMLLLLARAELDLRRGRLVPAAATVEQIHAERPAGHFRLALVEAELAWARNDAPASRFHARRGLASAGTVASPDELGRLCHALARSAVGAEDAAAALAPLDGADRHPLLGAWGATVRAELRERYDDAASAAAAWEIAAGRWRRRGRSPLHAHATWRQGSALVRAGDHRDAAAKLEQAARSAEALGATSLLVGVQATQAGSSWPGEDDGHGDGRADEPGARGAGLTPRETQVLGLVAEGWTNRRIATELGISPRTVGIHVSRILRKLGVDTRGEAAAVAHRAGLVSGPDQSPARS